MFATKRYDRLINESSEMIGNTDNHIKNLSLLYSENLRKIRLAPAYDIVSTAIYPSSNMNMAIGIAGERNLRKISREHFAAAAAEAGLSKRIALKHFDDLANGFEAALGKSKEILTDQGYAKAEEIRDEILRKGGYSLL